MEPTNAQGNPPPYTEKSGFPSQPESYCQPQHGAYGQPQPGAYGQPQPGAYGQPQPGAYGQPQPAGYGPPQSMTTTNTVVVTQPTVAMVPVGVRPRDYMVSAIFACLCCFWPTGACAIYYASQANSAAAAGDMVSAQSHANTARNLIIASVVIGIIWIVLVIVLRVAVYSTYSSSYNY